ncbi:mechanosensitive ion channel family protein [Algihabitans albus]|uniref:mechanosensitive ion channel family protein n=1 Tax=Algihabitans albus TaxID=2164067 RepID=UPI000E5D22AA|nr:mechanosensitive ion channel family protein [Algihabitans albus]
MDEVSLWIREVSATASGFLGQFVEFLPTLGGALAILIVGWGIARVLRSAGIRSSNWLNRFFDRRFGPERARHLRISNAGVKLLGNIIFWVIILFFITAATRVLGLDAFSAWLDRVVAYLPTLLAGGLIILVGLLISSLARDLTSAAVASAGVAHAELFGRSVQAAILITALVLGINQVGIDVTLLITLIAIVVAAVVGSLSLAFALGASSFVSNLIGSHYLQQHYRPGQQARMGEVEGEILELTPVSVVLATREGRVVVPGKIFNDQTTALLAEEVKDE